MTEKFKKSAVANAIAIPLPLCFSSFVPLRRFRENLIKPFYLYLSRTCDSPGVTPSVINLALKTKIIESDSSMYTTLAHPTPTTFPHHVRRLSDETDHGGRFTVKRQP